MPNEEVIKQVLADALAKHDPANFQGWSEKTSASPQYSSQGSWTPQEVEYMDRYNLGPSNRLPLSERLGQAQSSWDKLAKVPIRLAGSTLTKMGEGVGFVAGLLSPWNMGENYIANAADNTIAQFFAEKEEQLKAAYPMFNTMEDRDKNFFQRAKSDLDFWTDDAIDATAFLLSTWLPAAGLGKLKAGERVLSKLANYKGVREAAEAGTFTGGNLFGMTDDLVKTANQIDKLTQTAVLTASEAMFEADGVRKSIESEAFQKYKAGEITEEEYAAQLEYGKTAARDVFGMNILALGASNFYEIGLVNKILGKGNKPKLDIKTDLTKPGAMVTAEAAKSGKLAAVGKGILSEGFYEENIQFGIEEINSATSAENMEKGFWMKAGEVLTEMVNIPEYSKERFTAIGLGGLIGAPSALAAEISEANRNQKNAKTSADNLNTAWTRFKESGLYDIDENGNPTPSPEKIAAYQQTYGELSRLDDIITETEGDTNEKAKALNTYAKKKALSVLARQYYEAGQYDQFKELLKGVSEMSPEQVKALGFDPNDSTDPMAAKNLMGLVDKMETIFTALEKNVFDSSISPRVKKVASDQAVNILLMKEAQADLQNKMNEQVQKISESMLLSEEQKQMLMTQLQFDNIDNQIKALDAAIANVEEELPDFMKRRTSIRKDKKERKAAAAVINPEVAKALEAKKQELVEEKEQIESTAVSKVNDRLVSIAKEALQKQFGIDNAYMQAGIKINAANWEYLITPKGLKEKEEKLDQIEKRAKGISLSLLEASAKDYEDYEESVLEKEKYRTETQNTALDKNSKEIDTILESLGPEEAARKIIEDEKPVLKSLLDYIISALSPRLGELDAQAMLGFISEEEQAELAELKTTITKLKNLAEKSADGFSEINEEAVKRNIARDFGAPATEVLQNFDLNPEYDNMEAAQYAKAVLTKLIEILSERKGAEWQALVQLFKNKLNKLETEVIPEIEKRLHDREAMSKKAVSTKVKALFDSLGIGEEGVLSDLGKSIMAILDQGDFVTKFLAAVKEKGYTQELSQALLTKIALLPSDKKLALGKIIEIQKEKVLEGILPHFREDPKRFKANAEISINESINTSIHNLKPEAKELKRTANFIKALASTDKEFTNFLNLYLSFTSLREIERALELDGQDSGTFHVLNQILKELGFWANSKKSIVPPSDEQTYVIRQLAMALSLKRGKKKYGNFVYLKGFAGTGKTKIVANWLLKTMYGDISKVYATSTSVEASQELNKALGAAPGSVRTFENLLESLKDGSFNKEIIVIDEVGRLTKAQLSELATLVHNLNIGKSPALTGKTVSDPQVKVLLMGDPNQYIGDEAFTALSEFFEGHENIITVHQLSSKYRSDVQSIIDFQDLFVNNFGSLFNTALVVTGNSSNGFIANPLGVFKVSNPQQDVINWLQAQTLTDGKTRAIVTDEEKVAKYRELVAPYKGVEVYTVENIQGLTKDQVFVDLSTDNQGSEIFDTINQKMYTAFSRATEALYVANFNLQQAVRPEIVDLYNARKKQKSVNKEEFETGRMDQAETVLPLFPEDNFSKEMFERAKEGKVVTEDPEPQTTSEEAPKSPEEKETEKKATTSPTPKTETEKPQEEEKDLGDEIPDDLLDQEEEDTEEEEKPDENPPPSEQPAPSESVGKTMTFKHPTTRNVGEGKIQPGQRVLFVKQKSEYGNPQVVVIAENPKKPGEYLQVSVLSQEELNSNKELKEVFDRADTAPQLFLLGNERLGYQELSISPSTVVGAATVATAKRVKFNYGKSKPFSLESVLKPFVELFAKEGKPLNGAEYANMERGTKYIIFDKKTAKKFAEDNKLDFEPKVGHPYLILNFTRESKGTYTFLVKLRRKKLNPDETKAATENLELFRTLLNKMTALAGFEQNPRHANTVPGPHGHPVVMTFNNFVAKLAQGDFLTAKAIYEYIVTRTPGLADKAGIVFHDVNGVPTPSTEVYELARNLYNLYKTSEDNIVYTVQDAVSKNLYVRNFMNPFTKDLVDKEGNPYKAKIKGKVIELAKDPNNVIVEVEGKRIEVPKNELWVSLSDNNERTGAAQKELNTIAKSNRAPGGIVLINSMEGASGEIRATFKTKALMSSYGIPPNIGAGYTKADNTEEAKRKGKEARLKSPINRHLEQIEKYNPQFVDNLDLTTFGFLNTTLLNILLNKIQSKEIQLNRNLVLGKDTMYQSSTPMPIVNDKMAGIVELGLESIESGEISVDNFSTDPEAVTTVETAQAVAPTDSEKPAESLETLDIQIEEDDDWGQSVEGYLMDESLDKGTKEVDRTAAMKYLKRLFPKITQEELKFVNMAEMLVVTKGLRAWGYFKKGVIYVTTGTTDTNIPEKVLRHEAFHRVWNMYMTQEQRNLVLKVLAKKGIEPSKAEEYLANTYMAWERKSKVPFVLVRLFNSIKKLFGFFSANFKNLDTFFETIETGSLSTKISNTSNERAMIEIAKTYGSEENYLAIKNLVLNALKDALAVGNSRDDVPKIIKRYVDSAKDVEPGSPLDILKKDFDSAAAALKQEKSKLKKTLVAKILQEHFGKSVIDKETALAILEANEENIGTVTEEGVDEEQKQIDTASLKDHIVSSDEFDQGEKQSAAVKDALATIEVYDTEKSKAARGARLLDYKEAFALLARVANKFRQSDSLQDVKTSVTQALGYSLKNKSIARKIKELLDNQAYDPMDNKVYAKGGIKIEFEFAKDTDIEPTIITYEVEATKEKKKVLFTDPAYPNFVLFKSYAKMFAQKIGKENDEATVKAYAEVLQKLYKKSRDGEVIRNIMGPVASLVRKRPFAGKPAKTSFKLINGVYRAMNSMQYKLLLTTSGNRVAKSKVISLLEKHSTLLASETFGNLMNAIIKAEESKPLNSVTVEGSTKAPLTLFKEYMINLGLITQEYDPLEDESSVSNKVIIKSLATTFYNYHVAAKKLSLFKEKYDAIINKQQESLNEAELLELEAAKNKLLDEYEKSDLVIGFEESRRPATLGQYLAAQEQASIAPLVDIMKEYIRFADVNTVYKSGDGTRRWELELGSQARDVVTYLIDYWGKFTEDRFKQARPEYFSNPFFALNPIISGRIRIFNHVDHDSKSTDQKGTFSTPLVNENYLDVMERILLYYFVSNSNSIPSDKYVQPTFPNSNKPRIPAVELEIANKEELRKRILIALQQEAIRPAGLAIGKNVGYSNLSGIRDGQIVKVPALTEEDIANKEILNARLAEIEKVFEMEARVSAEHFIKNRYVFPMSDKTQIMTNAIKAAVKRGFGEIPADLDKFEEYNYLKDYKVTEEMIMPLMLQNVMNHYVNGYFLNQALTGDESQFKDAYDEIKRMSIAHATGTRPAVGSAVGGMKRKFKFVSIKDFEVKADRSMYPEELAKHLERIFGAKMTWGDGQGFVTESFAMNELKKGFGKNYQIGGILKPVYYRIGEDGIARAVKFSAVVLTKELQASFPELKQLAEWMEKHEIDMAAMDSAVKTGVPASVDMFTKKGDSYEANFDIDGKKFAIDLYSEHLRMQLNPRHELESKVSQPSQLLYFLLSEVRNWDKANKVYNAIATIINLRSKKFGDGIMANSRKQTPEQALAAKHSRQERIRKKVAANILTSGRQVQQAEHISDPELGLDFATLDKQAQISFNSLFNKETVNIKYPGTKMVLQSALFTNEFNENKNVRPRLVLKEGKLAAECYLPMKAAKEMGLKQGDIFFGFRIPSTEMHSGVPLLVKGFYGTETSGDNIIIVPSEYLILHGSDFDVDSLFVITRTRAKKDIIIDDIVFYKDHIYTEDDAKLLSRLREEYYGLMTNPSGKTEKEKEDNKKAAKKMLFDVIIPAEVDAYKNIVTNTFVEVLRDPDNLDYMLSPITMDIFKQSFDSVFTDIMEVKGIKPEKDVKPAEALKEYRDNKLPTHHAKTHQDNLSGNAGTGIFANFAKGYNYIMGSVPSITDLPQVAERLWFGIDGYIAKQLQRYEQELDNPEEKTSKNKQTIINEKVLPTPVKVGERIDSFINASIDNVKEQILAVINANKSTFNVFAGMLSVGVSTRTVSMFMLHPTMVELSRRKGRFGKQAKQVAAEILNDYIDSKLGEDKNVSYKRAKLKKEIREAVALEVISGNINFEGLKKEAVKDIYAPSVIKSDLTTEEVVQYLSVLSIASKANGVASVISTVSSISNGVKSLSSMYTDLKVTMKEIFTIYEKEVLKTIQDPINPALKYSLDGRLKEVNKVNQLKEGLGIQGFDIFGKNPLLNQIYLSTKQLIAHNRENFLMSSKMLEVLMRSVKNNFLPKLYITSPEVTLDTMAREFRTFILSGFPIYDKEGNLYIDMDFSKEPIVELGENTLTGKNAWIYRFGEKIEKLKISPDSGFLENVFLNSLEVAGKQDGSLYLSFPKMSFLDPREISFYRAAFKQLPEDIQKDLIKYLIVSTGLDYGPQSYGPIIPPKMFVPVATTLKNQFNLMVETAENKILVNEETGQASSVTSIDSKLVNVLHRFAIELGVKYANNYRSITKADIILYKQNEEEFQKGYIETVVEGRPAYIMYDLQLAASSVEEETEEQGSRIDKEQVNEDTQNIIEEESKDEEELLEEEIENKNKQSGPMIISYYGKMFHRIQAEFGTTKSLYQEIGVPSKTGTRAYLFQPYMLEQGGYSVNEAFNSLRIVRAAKNPKLAIDAKGQALWTDKSKSPAYPQGSIIGLRNISDIARDTVFLYKVISSKGKTMNRVYTLKPIGVSKAAPDQVVAPTGDVKAFQPNISKEDVLKCISK